MSWSPELPIGEFRPWPDTVHVVRGRTGETLRYVPERTCYDEGGTDYHGEQLFHCSECGCLLSLYNLDGTNTLCTSLIYDYPRYCPECGRKVVD